jgi:2'-hydroxyisoflavone reductase
VTGRVLLAGGGRFVGRRLLAELVSRGYLVDVLNRGLALPPDQLPDGARHLGADRTDPDAVRAAIGGRDYDAVFDTSGYRPGEVRSVLSTVDTGHYVYVSTLVVYAALAPAGAGPVPEVGPLDEEAPTVPPAEDGDPVHRYPNLKRAAELVLLDQDRVAATVLRPCGIYGAGDYWYRHDWFFDRVVRGRPVPVPDGHLDRRVHLTAVAGLVEVCLRAAGRRARGSLVLNVADRDSATCGELARWCAELAGTGSAVRGYPAERTGLVPDAGARARFPFGPEPGFSLSTDRARRELGWSGTGLREGTAALYRDFLRRYRGGHTEEPDLALDDAILGTPPRPAARS